jgi:hypothetical protein
VFGKNVGVSLNFSEQSTKDKITCKYRFLLLKYNHKILVLQQKKEKCVGLPKKLSSTRKLNDGDNYHHASPSKLHMVDTVLPALSHQQARVRNQGVATKN